jgi:hypothetical protein
MLEVLSLVDRMMETNPNPNPYSRASASPQHTAELAAQYTEKFQNPCDNLKQ